MLATHTTHDGFTLTIFGGGYSDYGLKIEKNGETLFNNPCYLEQNSYGFEEEESDDEENPETIIIDWDEDMWQKVLENEADSLLEGALPPETWETEGE